MKSLLAMMIILSSFQAIAQTRCLVEGRLAVFLRDGRIALDRPAARVKSESRESSWQDCYAKALATANSLPPFVEVVISGEQLGGESVQTNAYLYMIWKYQDSENSAGALTRYTADFEGQPRKGDLRLKRNGHYYQ